MKKILLWLVMALIPLTTYASTTPPPKADEVFQLSTKVIDPNTIILKWDIKPGFFLYRDRIKINSIADNNFHLGDIRFPKSLTFTDKQKKQFEIYRNNLNLPIALLGEIPGEGYLSLSYQGCADDGFCYPPQTTQIKININTELEVALSTIEPMPISAPMADVLAEGGNQIEQLFSSKNWGLIFLSFLGFGILLTFTPCVLPMMPVLSGIIAGSGSKISTRKAFFLSLSYVLSMAVTYAIFGAIVALAGHNLQITMQSPWAIGTFSAVFVLLSLSMFGFYDLRLPQNLQNKLTTISHQQATGQYVGAAIMGFLATLILSPCVTAPLIGALGYIASSGDVLRGAMSLFFLGLGMGLPLLLIGTSLGKFLPKVGKWMNAVKGFFGVLLLSVAIYLLARILPAIVIMAIWGSLLVFCGVFVGAFMPLKTHYDKLRKGTGIILLSYGLLILIGTSQGNINPLIPLSSQGEISAIKALPTKKLTTLKEVRLAIRKAIGTPVIIDFYADWCSSCQHIEATTLKNPHVAAALKDFAFIKVDVTRNNSASKALLGYFNVIAPPTFIFYNKKGKEMPSLRLVGEVTPDMFIEQLKAAKD